MATQPIAAYRQTSPVQQYTIGDGDAGTAQTVSVMYQQIYEGMKQPDVNAQAIAIVNQANPAPFDFAGQRRAIFNWFRRNIRFVRDPVGVETVRTAPETLRAGGGDCDCQTVLMGALLTTIGNHVRITTIQSQPGNPDFSHVFLEVLDGNKWVPVDAARPDAQYARRHDYFVRRFAWPNPYDPGADDLGRLSGYGLGQTARELNASYQPMQFARLGAIRGLGRLSAARRRGGRLRGLGQDDIDWSGIASAVSAGTTGAANIIRATNQPSLTTQLQESQLLQQQQLLSTQSLAPAGYVNLGGTLISTSTLLLGAAALAALMVLKR